MTNSQPNSTLDGNKIILYVGDVQSYLADLAKKLNDAAKLIDHTNYFKLAPGVYYTSIGDLPDLPYFSHVLLQANKIIYSPPVQWSDEVDGYSKMQYWTEKYLTNFYSRTIVEGFIPTLPIEPATLLELDDVRKTDANQLWSVGCSISHGDGVEPHQRYGQLIADQLKMPVSFLTQPGSSIMWAADQILRSDIRKGDLIVWGLTSLHRLPYIRNKNIEHINVSTFTKIPELHLEVDVRRLDHHETLYRAITDIFKVINFCRKIEAKLVLASLLDNTVPLYLRGVDSFIMLYGLNGVNASDLFFDIGSDGQHPGAKTHQWYASEILNKIS